MKEERVRAILMKTMNWNEEEVREKLNGPDGKMYVKKAELYERVMRNIEPNIDSVKAADNPLEAVLDARKNLTEQQKVDIRQSVYRENDKVYRIR